MELVLASNPSFVEASFPAMDLVAMQYDAQQVTLTLAINSLQSEPYPAGLFSPGDWPGLFGAFLAVQSVISWLF